jgi:hypothetical protein
MPVEFDIEETSVNLSGEVESKTRSELMDAATIGYNWSLELAPEDRGQLTSTSIAPEWRDGTLVWGYTAPYAGAQEYGTEPYYPPIKPLLEWAERVLGDRSAGYAVQEKIAQEGIEGKGYIKAGAERMKRSLAGERFTDLFDDID